MVFLSEQLNRDRGVAGWAKAPPINVCIKNIRIEAKTICHFMMIVEIRSVSRHLRAFDFKSFPSRYLAPSVLD